MRKLRESIGLTQKELATLAETSEAYIGHIESGRSVIGPDFAQRVAGATGAQFRQYKRGRSVVFKFTGLDWLGRPYNSTSFEEWKTLPHDIESIVDDASDAIKRILRSAFIQRRGYACLGRIGTAVAAVLDAKDDEGQKALSELFAEATPIPSQRPNEKVDEHRATFWTFGRMKSTYLTVKLSAHVRRPIGDIQLSGVKIHNKV
jgi:transcriptional regulator with XRE-family HTH domain